VKDRPALWMVLDAEEEGRLRRRRVVLDATSGNTGVALAMVCAVRGYALELCIPDKVSLERKRIARAFGAQASSSPIRSKARTARSARRSGAPRPTPTATCTSTILEPGESAVARAGNRCRDLEAERGRAPTSSRAWHVWHGCRYRARCAPRVFASWRCNRATRCTHRRLEAHADRAASAIWDERVADVHRVMEQRKPIAMTKRLAREEGIFTGPSGGAAVAAAMAVRAGRIRAYRRVDR